MHEKIRWARVLLEGIVIVASILLAFGIQALWDDRQDRMAVRLGLAGALEELAAVGAGIEAGIPDNRSTLARAETLRTMLDSVATGEAATIPDTVLAALFYDWISDPPTGMIRSFISSGHLEKVQDEELRLSLLAWIAMLDDQRDDQTRATAYGSLELQPYMRAEFDVVGAQYADRSASPVGLGHSTEVHATGRLRNLVVWQLRWLERIARQDEALLERQRELSSLIRTELELH